MDGAVGVDSLAAVAAVALLAPLVLGLLPRLLVPQVVLLLVSGIVIAPHVVGLGTSGRVQVLADVGLQFVFLPVALGMTTTALGTLLPMLRERDLLHGRLERYQSSSPMLRCPQEQGRAFT